MCEKQYFILYDIVSTESQALGFNAIDDLNNFCIWSCQNDGNCQSFSERLEHL